MKGIGECEILTAAEIEALVGDVLGRTGLPAGDAAAVARSIRRAETAGLRRVGLGLVPHVVEHLRCGRVNADATWHLAEPHDAALEIDAGGGFACPAFEANLAALGDRAQRHGIAALVLSNAYPLGSALSFLDHCTAQGLIGIACFAGVVARAADNGRLVLEIAPRTLGLPNGPDTVSSALMPVSPGSRPPDPGACPPFEGPLGPPFRLRHRFVAVRRDLWQPEADKAKTPPTASAAVQNSGIAVPVSLLEKIINA